MLELSGTQKSVFQSMFLFSINLDLVKAQNCFGNIVNNLWIYNISYTAAALQTAIDKLDKRDVF